MIVQMGPSQQVSYSVAIKDAAGRPATVQDAKWSITGPLRITESNPPVEPTPTPYSGTDYSCTVAAGGVEGTGTLTFDCDADLGAGVKPLSAISTIAVVTSNEAVVVELTAGPPTEQGQAPQPVQTAVKP